jgi:hypothetical protein
VLWLYVRPKVHTARRPSYLYDNKRADASLDAPPTELVSYMQLLGRSPDVAEDHELLFGSPRVLWVKRGPEGPRSARVCGVFAG